MIQGSESALVRWGLKGAIVSRIKVHVVSKLEERASTFREQLSFMVTIVGSLNIRENCGAVEELMERLRRAGLPGL